ncbi:hypothetical protein [Sorangium sp. So ce131]|uniref:hypothetical protein n=1 Tax=Sorangium sp. So ce131 TaxID=3133282 RepID=UPI003F6426D9
MRSRPFIALRLPHVVHPGEALEVDISLDSESETPIDFVRATLQYTQVLRRGPDQEIFDERERLVMIEDVAGRGRLGVGVHRYRASFVLPGDLPPTHAGAVAELRCRIRVLVSIPWWLDAEESAEVLIRPARTARPKLEPFTSSSARGPGPFVEVSLPGRTFAPGDVMAGAVAFGGLAGSRPRALDVALIGVERARAQGRRASSEVYRGSFFRDLSGVREGQEVPFRLAAPAGLTPAFGTAEVSLEYALEAAIEHAEGRVVHSVPVVVGPFAPRGGREELRPRVGADRWRAVWERAGERAGLSLREEGLGLRGVCAGCPVEVIPAEERSTSGLRATVRFAEPWGIDLAVRPRRLLERGGVVTGDEGLDRRFRVRGREEAQVLAALTPALRAALVMFHEADLDDARARVWWSVLAASDPRALNAFVMRVESLARALAEAGAALPPPAAMASSPPAWRRFAEESGGSLQVGPMRLTGYLEGARFEVATLFKGAAPVGTRVALRLEPAIEGAAGGSMAAKEALAAALREQVSWFAEVEGGVISVGPGEIAVRLAAVLGNPAAAREVLRPMLVLAREMRRERRGGPYR